ncbi:hypothetical protein BC834DRAFT_972907 [Gloeopeniophorella convolvens]|nr:hypothetical protein BC834DRAFT_972907 [Gloeopeniophorella convolvens]
MPSTTAVPFPAELFFEIALHLPAIADVFALGLTNRFANKALSAPALYKQRVLLRGWDTGAWDDENQAADTSFPALLKRWMRAEHACCRTEQLLDQAVVEGCFRIQSASPDEDEGGDEAWSWREWRSSTPNNGGPAPVAPVHHTRLDGAKSVAWVKRLSEVLPSVAMHHRLNNVPRVTDTRYHGAIKAFTLTTTQLCFSPELAPRSGSPNSLSTSSSSEYDWYERACFGMAALFMYDDAGPEFRTIFEGIWEHLRSSVLRALYRSNATEEQYSAIFIHNLSLRHLPQLDDFYKCISRRFSICLIVQLIMHLELRFEEPKSRHILQAPRIPRSGPVLRPYDEPFLLGPGSIRPWLQDDMAGTPFAGLSTSPRAWAGYYTTEIPQWIARDMPMFFDLQTTPPEAGGSRYISFQAAGEDAVGRFTLVGTCDSRTGLVSAQKMYQGMHTWEWDGVVTPFGMVGRWGTKSYGGWWWVWPREWSPTTRTSH